MNTQWTFCPSEPAAILFIVLFALTTLAHLFQAIFYKKIYCTVIICSGLIQTLNYIFRIISIRNGNSLGDYTAWFVLILVRDYSLEVESIANHVKIGPLFTNAFVYMIMGEFHADKFARYYWNMIFKFIC